MKLWIIAHTVTILSLLLTVGSTYYFRDPMLMVQLLSTIMIYTHAERIRKREGLRR